MTKATPTQNSSEVTEAAAVEAVVNGGEDTTVSVAELLESRLNNAVMNADTDTMAELRELFSAARNLIGKFNTAVEAYESSGVEIGVTKISLRSGTNNGRKPKDLQSKLAAIFSSPETETEEDTDDES